ncbi:MAG: alpha/beta hydrolase [Tahibacter sp.]
MDFAAWRSSGNFFEYRGHRIFYQHSGIDSGTGLLCIHGFPTASWDWQSIWPTLTQRFDRVLAPDLIGFGWSDKPRDYAYSVCDQADLCEALLKQRNIIRVHVVAHDLGDSVAQELLARDIQRVDQGEPSRIVSTVLLNGGLFPETHRPRLIQRMLLTSLGPFIARALSERTFARSFSAVFGARTQPNAEQLHECWQLIVHAQGQRRMHQLIRYIPERLARRARWVDALQRASGPVRLIVGMDDPVSGAQMVDRYRALIAHADIVELPGIGHYPQMESPRAVLDAMTDFHHTAESGRVA